MLSKPVARSADIAENPSERATAPFPERIVLRDEVAARRWLIRAIVDRVVELQRKRRTGLLDHAHEGHHDSATIERFGAE